MSWEKEYIIQVYENAANNLRLISTRLFNHTLMREFLSDCNNLEDAVDRMKAVTEFAKFAVKLGNVIVFTHSIPEFLNIGYEMQKQINDLIPVTREILDAFPPEEFARKLETLKEKINGKDIKINENDNLIEVLNFVRRIDDYLVLCAEQKISANDKENFIEIVNKIYTLLDSFNDNLILEMKEILIKLFNGIINRGKATAREIEAMRAALIVVVAKLKNKDVDIEQFIEFARNSIRKEE